MWLRFRTTSELQMTETEVSMDRLKHDLCVNIDENASLELTAHKSPEHEQVKDTSPTEHTPHSYDAPHFDTLEQTTPQYKTSHSSSPEAISPDCDTLQHVTPQSTTSVNKTCHSATPEQTSPHPSISDENKIHVSPTPDHNSPGPTSPHSDSHKHALIANDTNEHETLASTSPANERDSPEQTSSNRDVLEQSTPECVPGDDTIDQSESDKEFEQDELQMASAIFVEKVLSGIGQISLELQRESLSLKSESQDKNLPDISPIPTTSSLTLSDLSGASVDQLSPEQTHSEANHPIDSSREVCM